MSVTDRAGGKPPERLKKRAEFLAVRQGVKKRGPLFLLEALDRGDNLPPRVGFTVTKKVGNAAIRNRVRRRLREAVRTSAFQVMQPGTDYVIVGRVECLSAPFEAIAGELKRRISAPSPRMKPRISGSDRA